MNDIVGDVRQALRTLLRQRGLTAAALASLALGIGANTALFSVVYGVLMRPLPYADGERLIRVSEQHAGANPRVRTLLSNLTYHAWRGHARTLDGLVAYSGTTYLDTSAEPAVRVAGTAVTPELFTLLGARPTLGRLLLPEDAASGAAAVVVLSDAFWHERFGGDASAIGRVLTLDGEPRTIVGVASNDFYFPSRESRLWTPFAVPLGNRDPAQQSMSVVSAIGRLRPGASVTQAVAEGTAAARSVPRPPLAELFFGKGGPVEVRGEILLDGITEPVRPALAVLMGGVTCILLICCANVANLLLSRGVARQRELAMRAALGASRGRVVRQLVIESLTLSVLGGALGLLLAGLLLAALPVLAPANFPRLVDVRMDARTLAFAAFVSLFSGLLAGVAPALRSVRLDLLPALRDGVGASAGARALRLGASLLVAEAALSVVLLVGASLLVRSFGRLVAVDAGYDAAHVLHARVFLPGKNLPPERARAFVDTILERLRGLPGVAAAGAGNMAPMVGNTALTQFNMPDAGPNGEPVLARAVTYVVTPGYAEALSLRLRQGRRLNDADLSSGTQNMLVNEEFARAYLADGNPIIGRRYHNLFGVAPGVTSEIVGVVGNVLKNGLDAKPTGEIYLLPRLGYNLPSEFNVVVRTTGEPGALTPTLRSVATQLDPMVTLDVATLSSRVAASVAQPRFAAATLASFALVALALAAIGLYGVLSYQVSLRRREIGVRAALGASRGDIVGMVVRQGLTVTVAGLLLGVAAAAGLSRLLERLLFGVSPLDAASYAVAPFLLLVVSCVACLLPAWRAAAVEPTEALRCE